MNKDMGFMDGSFGVMTMNNRGERVSDSEYQKQLKGIADALKNFGAKKSTKKTFNVAIVGRQYYKIARVRLNDSLIFKLEPDNQYDNEAIGVYKGEVNKIGYIANSVRTNIQGCLSAGRVVGLLEGISDSISLPIKRFGGKVKFINDSVCIVEVEMVY